jgi:hypothetical protein
MKGKMKKAIILLGGILIPLMLLAQQERWVYIYNDPADGNDQSQVIISGADTNIYIGGNSGRPIYADYVISLTPKRDFRWGAVQWQGAEITVLSSMVYGTDGNIYTAGYWGVTSPPNFSITTSCVSNSGSTIWGTTYHDYAATTGSSIAYGNDGNIYVAGTSSMTTSPYYSSLIVLSYTSSGSQRWIYRYNPYQGGNSASDIVYGSDGYVYVCGSRLGAYAVISLNPDNGQERWVYTTGSGGLFTSIVYGSDGNIYTAGDGRFTSLTSYGTLRWENSISGSGAKIVYGLDGNLYVMSGTAVRSFTSAGQLRWTYNSSATLYSITYGLDGNVYAAGTNNNDFIVLCLSSDSGQAKWVYTYDGPAHLSDAALGVVYGLDGFIYATGFTFNSNNRSDIIVISLADTLVGVEEESNSQNLKAKSPRLEVYPNPFRNAVSIEFQIPGQGVASSQKSVVSIKIYNASGRLVRQFNHLTNYSFNQVVWDGTDDSGRRLPAGIYFVRVESDEFKETEKVILLR